VEAVFLCRETCLDILRKFLLDTNTLAFSKPSFSIPLLFSGISTREFSNQDIEVTNSTILGSVDFELFPQDRRYKRLKKKWNRYLGLYERRSNDIFNIS